MIDLSVIIVSYNTRELLHDCLASLNDGAADITIETFVVDNASRDGSSDMVAKEFPDVTLIQNLGNPGFAAANNQALARSTGQYVVLLNPDTVVKAQALTKLVRFMDAHPKAGYCGPRLLNEDGSHQRSARRFPTALSAAWNMLGRDVRHPESRHASDLHLAHGDRTEMRVGWLTGACLLARREALVQVGPLDDAYFMYFEETDWCKRMADAGWEGWYVPSAEVVHLGGQSSEPAQAHAPFFGNRPAYWLPSRRRYMRRHCGLSGLVVSEGLDIVLNLSLWMRHCWRRSPESRTKARRASNTLKMLLFRDGAVM